MRLRSPAAAIAVATFVFFSFSSRAHADPPSPSKVDVRVDTDGQELEVFDETNIVSMEPVRYRRQLQMIRTPEYERICTGPAPCATALAKGAHTFAVSQPGAPLIVATTPVTIDGPSKVQARITSTPGDLGLGILVGGVALAGGIAMVVTGAQELDACGEQCTHSQKTDGKALLAIGALVSLLGPVLGVAIASPHDRFEVSVTPLFAGPAAAMRESNGVAALRPEGLALAVRF